MTDRSRIDARPTVQTVERRMGVYLCPKCRRRVRRLRQPKQCCKEKLTLLGKVWETVNAEVQPQ